MSVNYQHTETVRTNVVVEPLNSSSIPINYLNNFPDELYNKTPDSHLFKLLFALIGPSGVGGFKTELFNIRRAFEASGLESTQLERFYGDAFKLAKLADEDYGTIPSQALGQTEWAKIKIKDESYRNRAIDYLHAARLGTTPEGVRLAAKSGLGKDVEIIENYQYLFDAHSDDPIGLENYGKTNTTSEFVVLPHYEIDRSYSKTLTFNPLPNGGFCAFSANNLTSNNITYAELNAISIQKALEFVNVKASVSGDCLNGFIINTINQINFNFINNLIKNAATISYNIKTIVGANDSQSVQSITPREQYDLQLALDYLSPVGSFFTYSENQSTLKRQGWASVSSTSSQSDVVRLVTGNQSVNWPPTKGAYWIKPGEEVEGPKIFGDNRRHYQAFHQPNKIKAYTNEVYNDINYLSNFDLISSQYISNFSGEFDKSFPYYMRPPTNDAFNISNYVYKADYALAPSTESRTARTSYSTIDNEKIGLINGIYPVGYLNLQNVPTPSSQNRFWASAARRAVINGQRTSEILEIDLGYAKSVNFIALEIELLPFDIKVEYDISDQYPARSFVEVTPEDPYPFETSIYYNNQNHSPWDYLTYNFTNKVGQLIFTRFIRLTFTRKDESASATSLFYDHNNSEHIPWPIVVRNLRIGRNVSGN